MNLNKYPVNCAFLYDVLSLNYYYRREHQACLRIMKIIFRQLYY